MGQAVPPAVPYEPRLEGAVKGTSVRSLNVLFPTSFCFPLNSLPLQTTPAFHALPYTFIREASWPRSVVLSVTELPEPVRRLAAPARSMVSTEDFSNRFDNLQSGMQGLPG